MKVKKPRLSLINKIVLWLNIFLCCALLLSYLAPSTDPKQLWVIAFFGLAYPYLLMANIIFIIYWLLFKRWYSLISIACIAIGWSVLRENVGFHFQQTGSDPLNGNLVHMMTYNVHNFKKYGSKNDLSTRNEILDIINQEQPDIVGFQEFYTRTKGVYDMRDSIMKIMHTSYYYFEPVIFNSSEAIGIAIFSKYPIVNQGLIPLGEKRSENACIYVDVKKSGRTFRIYSVHLQSVRFDPEDYKYIKGITGQNVSNNSSVWRLGSKLKNAFIKRSDQVVTIKNNASQCPYPYVISGDFNDTPASYAVNYMASGLKNAFRERGYGFGRTYNGSFPNFQIDYIMASQDFDIGNYQIIEKRLSDHYPVTSDLLLVH